ncbi:hypothetical protein CerSpe_166100 [Prunus speciosa]
MSNNMDKPSQDECGEESKKQGKAHWDDEALDAFIKICVVETIAGNRPGGHFSKQGWKNVVRKFSELTQRTYTQKQLKNKWTGLKKDWQLWTSLVGKETGLGWDPVKKTINASNEWWDKKVKETPEAAKFRTCGLKHADQLDILFKDIAVTGDGAWAPSQGFVHDVENELTRPTENSPEDVVYDLENGLEFNDGLDNIDDVDTSPNIETSTQDKAKRKRDGKKPAVGEKVIKRLDSILESVANRSSRNNDKPGCSIEEVMQVVEGIPEIVEDDELFVKAADVLTERKNREMFVALRQANRQIMWLRSKKV